MHNLFQQDKSSSMNVWTCPSIATNLNRVESFLSECSFKIWGMALQCFEMQYFLTKIVTVAAKIHWLDGNSTLVITKL